MLDTKDMPPAAKPHLTSFLPYSPGKPAAEVEQELGLGDVQKMASNENPLGMSPKARSAVAAALADASIYPDSKCARLTEEITHHEGVAAGCAIAGNGAVELIYYLTQCFLSAGDETVTSEVSFSAYTIASRIQDAVVRTAPLAADRYDLPALAKLVNERTKLVFIANPNNPTGTIVRMAEVTAFMRDLPARVLLVLDEAYHDFVHDPGYRGSVELVREGKPVVVLRSLSKSLGLAGLRIGYALARQDIIRILHQVRVPFHVNSLAQHAAIAGLNDGAHLARTVQLVEEGKEFLYRELSAMGLTYAPTEANFVWIRVGLDAQQLFQRMMTRGVIIRPGGQFGAPEHIRVTIGLPAQNRRFVEVLRTVLAEMSGR